MCCLKIMGRSGEFQVDDRILGILLYNTAHIAYDQFTTSGLNSVTFFCGIYTYHTICNYCSWQTFKLQLTWK
jgi:hypothetical protein